MPLRAPSSKAVLTWSEVRIARDSGRKLVRARVRRPGLRASTWTSRRRLSPVKENPSR
jgi:hypothetical protein